jgi:outer membrane lipopolysaccharide assembly protein LptE/RlpB
MKSRTRYIVAAVSAAAILVTAGCGYAFRSNPQRFATIYVEHVAKELQLNELQTAKLHLLKDSVLTMRESMRADRERQQQAALALLEKPTVDRPRAFGLLQDATREIHDQAADVLRSFADFYDTLSPPQQRKVRETLKEWTDRFNR